MLGSSFLYSYLRLARLDLCSLCVEPTPFLSMVLMTPSSFFRFVLHVLSELGRSRVRPRIDEPLYAVDFVVMFVVFAA